MSLSSSTTSRIISPDSPHPTSASVPTDQPPSEVYRDPTSLLVGPISAAPNQSNAVAPKPHKTQDETAIIEMRETEQVTRSQSDIVISALKDEPLTAPPSPKDSHHSVASTGDKVVDAGSDEHSGRTPELLAPPLLTKNLVPEGGPIEQLVSSQKEPLPPPDAALVATRDHSFMYSSEDHTTSFTSPPKMRPTTARAGGRADDEIEEKKEKEEKEEKNFTPPLPSVREERQKAQPPPPPSSPPESPSSSLSPPSSRRKRRGTADLSSDGSDGHQRIKKSPSVELTKNETEQGPGDGMDDDALSLHSHPDDAQNAMPPIKSASVFGVEALPYSAPVDVTTGTSARFPPNTHHQSGFVNAATRSSSAEEEYTALPPRTPVVEAEGAVPSFGNELRQSSRSVLFPRNQSAFSNGVHSSSVFEQGFSGEYAGSTMGGKGLPFDPSMTFVHLDAMKTDDDDEPLGYDSSIGDGGFSNLIDRLDYVPTRRPKAPKPQKKNNTPYVIQQIQRSVHRLRRNLKEWSWHQIIWITFLLALVTVGNFLQIIMLNFWLVSFPEEVAASNYTVFALPGVLFFVFFAVTQVVYLIAIRPNMSFAKSWSGQWLLFLVGFMDAVNSWMSAYAASYTSEVLQALFMNLSPVYAVFMSKWILRDDRRYMNRWMIAVFVLTIIGVFVVTIYTFVMSPTFGNVAWIAIFFFSIPLRVLMNVWQSLYMIVYTYDPTFNEWLERRYIEEEVENAIRQQQGDLLLSQKKMRKRRKRLKINKSKKKTAEGNQSASNKEARKESNAGVKSRPSASSLGAAASGIQGPAEGSQVTHSSTHDTGSVPLMRNASSPHGSQNRVASGEFVMNSLNRPTGNGFSGTFSAEHPPLPLVHSSPLGGPLGGENNSAAFSGVGAGDRELSIPANYASGSGSFVRQTMVSGLFNQTVGGTQRSVRRIKRKKLESEELHVPTSPPTFNIESSVFKSRSSWAVRTPHLAPDAKDEKSPTNASASVPPRSFTDKENESKREKKTDGKPTTEGASEVKSEMGKDVLSPLTVAPAIDLHEPTQKSPTMFSAATEITEARHPTARSDDEREISKTLMFSAHLDSAKEKDSKTKFTSRRESTEGGEVHQQPSILQTIHQQSIVAQQPGISGTGYPDEEEYEYVEEGEEDETDDDDESPGRIPSAALSPEGVPTTLGTALLYYRELEPDGVLNVLRSGTGEVVFRGEEREGLAALQNVGAKMANFYYGDDEDLDDGDDFDRVVRPNQPLGIPLRQQSRVIGIGTGIKLGGFRRSKRLYTPSAQISPYQKHYRELQDREGEDTSVKVFMLFSDTFWQLVISLALLPADALPWFGNSDNVNNTWHNFMEGIEIVFTVKENTLYGFLYTLGFVFNYLGAAYLNHYSVALCSIVTQLSSPITALVLVIIPSWNKNDDGTPPWYLSLVSIVMLSVAALIYVMWEEKTDDEKKEGEMQLKRYKLKL